MATIDAPETDRVQVCAECHKWELCAVEGRHGCQYVAEVVVPTACKRCQSYLTTWMSCGGGFEKRKLYFKEEEVSKIMHYVQAGFKADIKDCHLEGNLVTAARTLWPSGTPEHYALKTVGIWALVSCMRGNSRNHPEVSLWNGSCCNGAFVHKLKPLSVRADKGGALPIPPVTRFYSWSTAAPGLCDVRAPRPHVPPGEPTPAGGGSIPGYNTPHRDTSAAPPPPGVTGNDEMTSLSGTSAASYGTFDGPPPMIPLDDRNLIINHTGPCGAAAVLEERTGARLSARDIGRFLNDTLGVDSESDSDGSSETEEIGTVVAIRELQPAAHLAEPPSTVQFQVSVEHQEGNIVFDREPQKGLKLTRDMTVLLVNSQTQVPYHVNGRQIGDTVDVVDATIGSRRGDELAACTLACLDSFPTPEDKDWYIRTRLTEAFTMSAVVGGKLYRFVAGTCINRTEVQEPVKIQGLVVMPSTRGIVLWDNTAPNVEYALTARLLAKQKQVTYSKEDVGAIHRLVHLSMHGQHKVRVEPAEQTPPGPAAAAALPSEGCTQLESLFNAKYIREWACEHLHLHELKSPKWSNQRFEAAVHSLIADLGHERVTFKAQIKNEPMPSGKPPRVVINEGDSAQVMSLLVISCFEHLLFARFGEHSIKKAARKDALTAVFRRAHRRGVTEVVEGDGSAWDTTCSVEVREIIENPVLLHITKVLSEYFAVPETWLETHMETCEAPTLTLQHNKKRSATLLEKWQQEAVFKICAIRRSGHRGTSCLNWWVNYVMWTTCIFGKDARLFLDSGRRSAKDRWGQTRWFYYAFEGDDSLLATQPRLVGRAAEIEAYWSRGGFRMKLVWASETGQAEFCGSKAVVAPSGCTGDWCPDLKRALANGGISTSPSIARNVDTNDCKALDATAYSLCISRAYDFAGKLPTVSKKYLQMAQLYQNGSHGDMAIDREAIMIVGGRELWEKSGGKVAGDYVVQEIEKLNHAVTPGVESIILRSLDLDATEFEMDQFINSVWSPSMSAEEFRAVLPAKWC